MNPAVLHGGRMQGPGWEALAHNGLASHSQEWMREWQRAQSRAWLHATPAPDLARNDDAAASARADRHPVLGGHLQATMHVVPPETFNPAGGEQGASSRLHVGPSIEPWRALPPDSCRAANVQTASDAAGQGVVSRGWQPAATEEAVPGEPVRRALSRACAADPAEKESLRLHVERSAQGLHVWIGVDGDASAVRARAAAILAELRRTVEIPSLRLASIVCNGRPLYVSSHCSTNQPENSP